MALGAVMWLVGNLLWLSGESIYSAVPWWAGFLILTICGERLELSRVLWLKPVQPHLLQDCGRRLHAGADRFTVRHWKAACASRVVGLILLGAWLLRFDIARHTIKKTGLTRYIAACLLPGYVWLSVAGLLWSVAGYRSTTLMHGCHAAHDLPGLCLLDDLRPCADHSAGAAAGGHHLPIGLLRPAGLAARHVWSCASSPISR